MRNFRKILCFATIIVVSLAIAGCKSGSFEKAEGGAGPEAATPQAGGSESGGGEGDGGGGGGGEGADTGSAEQAKLQLTSLKLVRLDDVQIDLLVTDARLPVPLRPKYIEAEFSSAIDCISAQAKLSIVGAGGAGVGGVSISCPDEKKARFEFAKDLNYDYEYKIRFGTWDASGSNLAFDGREDVPFKTMFPSDLNGDGVPDFIVGAPDYDGRKGAVYVFSGKSVAAGESTPLMLLSQDRALSNFGISVFGACDINADGYADVIAGMPGYDGGRGALLAFNGAEIAAGRPTKFADLATSGAAEAAGSSLGYSIACEDLNEDGYADIIAGAPYYNTNKGALFIFDGKELAEGRVAQLRHKLVPTVDEPSFGYCVATIGDVTGDGRSDVMAGANEYLTSKGAVFMFSGVALGSDDPILVHTPKISPEASSWMLGEAIAGAGDLNNDGTPDVIVGEYGTGLRGVAHVYSGSSLAAEIPTKIVSMTGEADNSYFGSSIAAGWDINGDGIPDVAVGAPGMNSHKGAVYIYDGKDLGRGRVTLVLPAVATTFASANFGNAVAWLGDIDGDGVADVAVGAPGYLTKKGAVAVYSGKELANGRATRIGPRLEGPTAPAANSAFGSAVSGVGYINRGRAVVMPRIPTTPPFSPVVTPPPAPSYSPIPTP